MKKYNLNTFFLKKIELKVIFENFIYLLYFSVKLMSKAAGKFSEEKILKCISNIKRIQRIEASESQNIFNFQNLYIVLDFLSKGILKHELDKFPKEEFSGGFKILKTNRTFKKFGLFIKDNYKLLGISEKDGNMIIKNLEIFLPLCNVGDSFSESDIKKSLLLTYDTLFRYSEAAKHIEIEEKVKNSEKSRFQVVIPEEVIKYQKKLEEMPNNENFKIIYNSKPSEPPKPRENIPIMTEIIEPSIKADSTETLTQKQENLPDPVKEIHSLIIKSINEKENSEEEIQARKSRREKYLQAKRKFLEKQALKKKE